MKRIPLKFNHSVETANGQTSVIEEKVEFLLLTGDITQKVQAYVFDTKFDLILGQNWFKQFKTIPDWPKSQWKLVSNCGLMESTLIPSNVKVNSEHDGLVSVISKKTNESFSQKRRGGRTVFGTSSRCRRLFGDGSSSW